MIYGDFECPLILTDNIDFGPNIKKYPDHIVCSYGYKMICVDDRHSKLYKTYFGEDRIDKFLYDMIKESEHCSKVIETEVNKLLVISEKDHQHILIILLNAGFIEKHMKKVK